MVEVKLGDRVKARWFDNPTWYEGIVLEDSEGELFLACRDLPYGRGYLKFADEVKKVE